MSNAKWRKLLIGIDEAKIVLPVSEWLFLHDDRWFSWHTPKPRNMDERGILDRDGFYPFLFKEVERVRWPSNYEMGRANGVERGRRRQDIAALERLMRNLGSYDCELGEHDLTLFAYRRPPDHRPPL